LIGFPAIDSLPVPALYQHGLTKFEPGADRPGIEIVDLKDPAELFLQPWIQRSNPMQIELSKIIP
jgi:hypothetical protein